MNCDPAETVDDVIVTGPFIIHRRQLQIQNKIIRFIVLVLNGLINPSTLR